MNATAQLTHVIDEICQIDPRYRDDIRGVDEPTIERLQALCGRPLPEIYRSFLHLMGDAWGIPTPNTDFRAQRIIEYYEEFPWRPSPPFTMIGMDISGLGTEFFLDERTDPPLVVSFYKGEPPLPIDEDPEDYEVEASSLPDFIFMTFFFLRHIKGSPVVIDACKGTNLDGMFEKSIEILRKHGLPEHPRSGGRHYYFHEPAVSVVVHQPGGYGLGIDIGGRDAGRVEQIFALLDDHVGLVRGRG